MPELDSNQDQKSLVSTSLAQQSNEILNQLIAENDRDKTNELIDLFNNNQKKKTAIRADKLSTLLDIVTDQTIERFTNNANEITTQETLQALKTVQDLVDKSQKALTPTADNSPLIQINQQNNEVNLGEVDNLSKESRDRVKNAVASLLSNLTSQTYQQPIQVEGEEKHDK